MRKQNWIQFVESASEQLSGVGNMKTNNKQHIWWRRSDSVHSGLNIDMTPQQKHLLAHMHLLAQFVACCRTRV